ncbi:bile acid:sodium symporter family protein [Aequorivita sp. F47161]|uniref:Bile acid:sodium symporter family protein n=1 Tax=Aequorivita vitellina TaxID=2874475 RepID=A0A9X1QXH4_9FLAO|nr:bile acid:sodium symporter family protein [Aequorivita vitellina]MCG2418364.1 bile acid:sodium symporter family protein [Aequorivita vitellina]
MDNLSTIILAGSLIVIMLGMGLTLQSTDFKRIFRYPKAIFIGLTNQLILLPLVGFGITLLFPMQPEIAIGVIILAACPGGPTSNLISHLAKADLALSVTLTAFSSLITILTIPFIVNFGLEYFLGVGQVVELNVLSTIVQIFVIVVIPIIIGMLVRSYKPSFANNMAKPVRIASGAVLALIIIGLVIKERANFVSYFEQAGIAALALNVVTMVLGYFSAKLFGLGKAAARSIAIESGIQNGTLAITIAVVLLHNASFAIVPAVYSLLMFVTGGVLIYFFNREAK